MQSNSYTTPIDNGTLIVDDNAPDPALLKDSDLQLERESRARSGNYLETIATELENLTSAVEDELVIGQIDTMVKELLYIHERYELVKRTSSQFTSRLQ